MCDITIVCTILMLFENLPNPTISEIEKKNIKIVMLLMNNFLLGDFWYLGYDERCHSFFAIRNKYVCHHNYNCSSDNSQCNFDSIL